MGDVMTMEEILTSRTEPDVSPNGTPKREPDLAAMMEPVKRPGGVPQASIWREKRDVYLARSFGRTIEFVAEFRRRLAEFDSLGDRQAAYMRDKYPDYAYAARMCGLTADGQIQFRVKDQWHKQLVKEALQARLPVPPEVLADYPDLAASLPEPAPVAAKPEHSPERQFLQAISSSAVFSPRFEAWLRNWGIHPVDIGELSDDRLQELARAIDNTIHF